MGLPAAVLVVALLASQAPVTTGTKPSVAVLQIQALQGASPDAATLLTSKLVTRLRDTNRFGRVVAASEIQTLLGFEAQQQLMACDTSSSSCMAEIAGALGVDFLISGTLGQLGDQLLLNLSLLNRKTAQSEGVRALQTF